ncbi:MAG: hypothetical protein [Wendovervirus sonii]|uniref:Uncharacterized protein n=1 Tax=phage Lak_Megaphage_Sonny TaxID=3109229 RepID=A0ABZ0Z6N8_9CAUD|nr:MAG: hypothetical protein [phage Lak_Megaphage_Sonny]
MKYLYKKIYEAINTGIQKALVLDDESDISINYQHKKIINNENLMPYYVNDLLQGSDIEYNYEQIIKYYKESGYKYKLKNFNKLRSIFDKIKNIENASFEWISNLKDYISIVLDDKSEINFYEGSKEKPLFLKFANDDILGTENEIMIYLHDEHYIPKKEYQWQTKEVQIQNSGDDENIVEKNYAGYETCLKIHDAVTKEHEKYGEIPAIDYCLNQKVNGFQGYLPTINQLWILSDNIDMINYIFEYLGLNKIKHLNNDCWWSSTEWSYYASWILHYGSPYYGGDKVSNDSDIRIFPLFAIKK